MKKTLFIAASMLLLVTLFAPGAKAQEWSTGLDIYSSYIWRGAKFGSGPAFQPSLELNAGGFAIGAWGSVSSSVDEGFEMDLYVGYSFDLGEGNSLSLTVTDYYFGGDWTSSDYHSIEPMVGVGLGGLSLTGAYMFLPDGAMSADGSENDGDVYVEASYSFEKFSIGVGAGEGQYTLHADDEGNEKDDFGICNINIGTSKEVKITDTFTLPVSGAVILNPTTGGFFITVGISL
ncbi:TorF family putative porin [Maribellus sp. YY47]|uniref:TorF family putative porin n=1 Tax=Maribellus sp. YY47 TaxID=2929486 RepID=UPI002000D65D|nr:TorF family putative porin [Maribellus sp. YY47]MCK3682623.1 TorF family putative porin [Maribellus sp. YY47]